MSGALFFAYPGKLDLNTGGYAYDRRVIRGLDKLGWDVRLLSLGDGFPFPTDDTRHSAEEALSALADGDLVMLDGLAFGVLGDWAEREAERLRLVALVHHPLALETGLDEAQRQMFHASEVKALSHARHVIVTSPMTARELSSHYGVQQDRITVAIPGTDPASASIGDRSIPHIISIGTLTPRKGHDILLAALKQVEDLDWTATIVGSRALNAQTTVELDRQLEELGLGERVTLPGECDDPRELLANADIFALASRYEGFGMVFAEALSHGLPIVACSAGAIPDVVPEDAGILVPVDDVSAFAAGLRRLLSDPDERRMRAKASRLAGAKLPGWDETASIISSTLEMKA
ncbi:glycosyltransferase family 4 protein [Agrobacterium sp. ES01]|uniref:glycosyltransferase family 4 protein n=1 Tax=Agrobacterium sp. ES01 TaxID=3420714 RepID=UPI003D0C1607